MKQFKIIDFWVSAGLIISFTITSVIEGFDNFLTNYFFVGYFVVGGWQVFSMLVHAFNHWFTIKKSTRYFYHWITFISLITICLLVQSGFCYLQHLLWQYFMPIYVIMKFM
jgi:hypothetical protein